MLAAVLAVLLGAKLAFNPGLGRNSLDGDFYFQIARNVAEGRGLQTNVSLYHQGLESFPHPTNAAPLWPLLLGFAGRWSGMFRAAAWLPELIYLLDLLLLYLLTLRLAASCGESGASPPASRGAVDLGHVAVLLFGTNPVFFEFTSLPYTEALAFLLLFAGLLAADRAATSGRLSWALAAGAVAGLGFATRAQLAGLVVGVPLGLLLLAARERWLAACAFASAVGSALVVAPWVLFLRRWVVPFDWHVMIGLGAYRETPEVPPFRPSFPRGSLWEQAGELARGIGVAFNAFDPNSYLRSFGPVALLVPLAAGVLLVRALAKSRGREPFASWPTRRHGLLLIVLFTGLVALWPVHRFRAWFFKEWLFGFRHGLPFILLIVAALCYLHRRGGRWLRGIVLGLAAASALAGGFHLVQLLRADFASGVIGGEAQLVEWLDSQRPLPTVVTTNAQPLSVFSRANFHWMECREPADATRALLRDAGADYVLLYPGEQNCAFLSGLEDELILIQRFDDPRLSVGVLAPRGVEGDASEGAQLSAAGAETSTERALSSPAR